MNQGQPLGWVRTKGAKIPGPTKESKDKPFMTMEHVVRAVRSAWSTTTGCRVPIPDSASAGMKNVGPQVTQIGERQNDKEEDTEAPASLIHR